MSARRRESVKQVGGSEKARRQTAVILEVLSGLRGTQEASEAMGVSPNRYYQLEARALEGMVKALEPRPRGRGKGPEEKVARLEGERERLSREVVRLQALVRVAQRSLGIEVTAKAKEKRSSRRRKPSHRGKKVVALLRRSKEDGAGAGAKAS